MPYLPDWLYAMVPRSLWPESPRDYYTYSLNVLPILAGQTLTSNVSFNKRLDTLVFGAIGLPTTLNDQTIVTPLGGTSVGVFVRLSDPANQLTFSSDPVPWENVFGDAGAPMIWPIPIHVQPGAMLQMTLQSFLAVNINLRISFHVALVDRKRRKAA